MPKREFHLCEWEKINELPQIAKNMWENEFNVTKRTYEEYKQGHFSVVTLSGLFERMAQYKNNWSELYKCKKYPSLHKKYYETELSENIYIVMFEYS